MNLSKILGVILIILSMLLLSFETQGLERNAIGTKGLAMCILVVLYFRNVTKQNYSIILFFITYAVALILDFSTYSFIWKFNGFNIRFITINMIYVLAYVFLISRIFGLVDFVNSIKTLPFQMLSLLVLGFFLVYMITDVTMLQGNTIETNVVQLIYISVIIFMMCLSVINYIYNTDKKSLILLFGTVLIVFSEVIQIAYYYLTNLENALNIVYSSFTIFAFALIYGQSHLVSEPKDLDENCFEEISA